MTEPFTSENRPRLQEVPANPAAVLRRNGFRLDDWWVEPPRNRIVSAESERRLDPRVMDVLVHLATRAGEVIPRDELSDAVWKDAFISENTVSQAVSRLRKALGDDSQQPRFIETISKSGYRLVAGLGYPGVRRKELGPRRTVTPANVSRGFSEHSCGQTANVFAGGRSVQPIPPWTDDALSRPGP